MSPTKIPDEKRGMLWQMMLALAARGVHNHNELPADAWGYVESYYGFLAAKERENNFIPADDIDEGDGP